MDFNSHLWQSFPHILKVVRDMESGWVALSHTESVFQLQEGGTFLSLPRKVQVQRHKRRLRAGNAHTSSLYRVAGLSPEEPLHVDRSQVRWFRHLLQMPPEWEGVMDLSIRRGCKRGKRSYISACLGITCLEWQSPVSPDSHRVRCPMKESVLMLFGCLLSRFQCSGKICNIWMNQSEFVNMLLQA